MAEHHGTAPATIGVLALQGAVAEHLAILRGLGANARTVRTIGDLAGLSGLIIPGGESTAMARLAVGTGLFAAIRERIDMGTLAVLGTCAGLILLSDRVEPAESVPESIGGLPITTLRNGFGNQLNSFEAELDLEGRSITVAFIRAPQITNLGPDVRVLARYEGEPVVVEHRNILAATCHPEITGETALHERLLGLTNTRGHLARIRLAPETAQLY